MFKKLVAVCLLAFLYGCQSVANEPLIEPDPNWTTGQLSNGFRYHLYPIDGEEIELRLIVNVGSLAETEEQRGYAHFIEHMAFNGTRNFPANSVFDEFAKVGVEFGPDINASTDYTRTIYSLSLPDVDSLDKAMIWFRDISDGMNLSQEEIAKEADVIFGEWRLDNNRDSAWQTKAYEALLADTIYGRRDPIGTSEALKRATAKSLGDFYRHWYQANRMQLVVVGGFEPKRVEKNIESRFSSLRKISTEPEPHQFKAISPGKFLPETLLAHSNQPAAVSVVIGAGKDFPVSTLVEQQTIWFDWVVLDLIEKRISEQLDRKNIGNLDVYNAKIFAPGNDV